MACGKGGHVEAPASDRPRARGVPGRARHTRAAARPTRAQAVAGLQALRALCGHHRSVVHCHV